MPLLTLLVAILVGILIVGLLLWIVTLLPDPPFTPNLKNVARIVVALIVIVVLLAWLFGGFPGGPVFGHWR